jgi:hypothetical protein
MAVLNNWSPPRVSQLLVDADLTIPDTYKITCMKIQADPSGYLRLLNKLGNTVLTVTTSAAIIDPTKLFNVNSIAPYAPAVRVDFPDGITTDCIDDSGAAAIDILESVAFAAGKSASIDSLLTDGISERTGSAGVSVLDVLEVDHIAEQTASAGITFDDDLNIDTDFEAKVTQRYRSASAGDTLRYGDATEVFYNTPGTSPGEILKQVTIPDVYLDTSCTFRISFTAKKTAVGAAYASVWINGIEHAPSVLTLTTDYQVKSRDIGSLTGGDVITVHVYGVGAQDMYIKDFTVKSTDSVYTPLAASPTWSP